MLGAVAKISAAGWNSSFLLGSVRPGASAWPQLLCKVEHMFFPFLGTYSHAGPG